MRSVEIKQNSGRQERWTSETAVCDRSWLERPGDRVVSTAAG